MVFGTIFLGKVKELNKQSVETKFVIIGLPLFPISSMLVLSSGLGTKQGIPIPLNSTSVIAGYARIWIALIAAGCLIAGSSMHGSDAYITWIGVVAAALWVYFFFYFGKPTESEIKERNMLGSTTGLYALGSWFDSETALDQLRHSERLYAVQFGNSNWKKDIDSATPTPEMRKMFYPLALFNYLIDQSSENEAMLLEAEKTLN